MYINIKQNINLTGSWFMEERDEKLFFLNNLKSSKNKFANS